MDTLLVECPIHLDAVPINDIRVFKCGHGFCEPCMEAHFARNTNPLTCPSCRKQVKRKEAFQLFLTPARSSTQALSAGSPASSPSRQRAAETMYRHLMSELDRVQAEHTDCSTRYEELQNEVEVLNGHNTRHVHTIHVLRDRKEELERRLVKELDMVEYTTNENDQLKEEMMTLRAENQKSAKALDETRQELQTALERVKDFQGYIEKYKRKIELEKKKRKALEQANQRSPKKAEDESLMIVDTNTPDILHPGDADFGWLDEACEVKGDMLDVTDGESEGSETERERELLVGLASLNGKQPARMGNGKGNVGIGEGHGLPLKEDRALKPRARFSSDWSLGPEVAGPSPGFGRKRKPDSSRVGGSKLFKVKATTGSQRTGDSVLAIDRRGHVKGTVVLGSRQKLNSKN